MKLYVGNLPFSVNEETLKKAFSEFGSIEEATIIFDKFSNRSKGFGFVEIINANSMFVTFLIHKNKRMETTREH